MGLRAATRFGKVTGEVHADQYNKAIGDHLDAVLGGSDFPDWGYEPLNRNHWMQNSPCSRPGMRAGTITPPVKQHTGRRGKLQP